MDTCRVLPLDIRTRKSPGIKARQFLACTMSAELPADIVALCIGVLLPDVDFISDSWAKGRLRVAAWTTPQKCPALLEAGYPLEAPRDARQLAFSSRFQTLTVLVDSASQVSR